MRHLLQVAHVINGGREDAAKCTHDWLARFRRAELQGLESEIDVEKLRDKLEKDLDIMPQTGTVSRNGKFAGSVNELLQRFPELPGVYIVQVCPKGLDLDDPSSWVSVYVGKAGEMS